MYFLHPQWFWLYAAWPLLLIWARIGDFARAKGWKALGKSSRPANSGGYWWWSAGIFVIAALARPTWGRLPEMEGSSGRDVAIVLDVSKSMAAEDAAPNRFEVARTGAKEILQGLKAAKGDRAVVVAFAGRGETRCALTEDVDAAIEAVDKLAPGAVSPGGTNLRLALETAIDAFDDETRAGGRAVIVFSDGEDLDGDWPRVLARLKQRQIVVHSVAIGDDRDGGTIPIPNAQSPLKYRDTIVISKRRDSALKQIAEATGGSFIPLGLGTADLGALYRDRIEPLARRRREATRLFERTERFPIALGLALGLTIVAGGPRRRFWISHRTPHIFLLLIFIVGGVGAGPFETPERAIAEGLRLYKDGDFAQAESTFGRALTIAPKDPIAHYDLAATLYQMKRYRPAIEHYRTARERADEGLRMKIDFALGNAALASGDVRSSLRYYDTCISSKVFGSSYEAIRVDARTNRLFAARQADRLPNEPDEGDKGGSGSRSQGDGPEGPAKPSPADPNGDPAGSKLAPKDRDDGSPSKNPPPRSGGAGGSAPSSSNLENSPRSRLAEAVQDMDEALKRRIAVAPKAANDGNGKDW